MNKELCVDCYYSDEHRDNKEYERRKLLVCKRYPPVYRKETHRPEWPIIYDQKNDGCGEFEPNEVITELPQPNPAAENIQ